jgi:hypothetical protein
MQAAVVSVLLMAGVCGGQPVPCGCENSPIGVQQGYDGSWSGGSWGSGSTHDRALWSPVTPNGTVTYDRALFGCPMYSPLWIIHWNAKYYPGDYAKPYDYREAFDYPWNGPRPLAPPPLGPPIAPGQFGPWSEAASSARDHQPSIRIASKPILEAP